jgi:hypothetical protein
MSVPVARRAQAAKKPSPIQIYILLRMRDFHWKIAGSEWLSDAHGALRKRVNARTLAALTDNAWIKQDALGCWRLSDAGRKAAE